MAWIFFVPTNLLEKNPLLFLVLLSPLLWMLVTKIEIWRGLRMIGDFRLVFLRREMVI